jgi:hypothetical protein
MNKEKILALADALDSARGKDTGFGFNMDTIMSVHGAHPDMTGHDCDTVGCIAGWAVHVLAGIPLERMRRMQNATICRLAGEELGLTDGQIQDLFFPSHILSGPPIGIPAAIETLRNFAETGLVSWGTPVRDEGRSQLNILS